MAAFLAILFSILVFSTKFKFSATTTLRDFYISAANNPSLHTLHFSNNSTLSTFTAIIIARRSLLQPNISIHKFKVKQSKVFILLFELDKQLGNAPFIDSCNSSILQRVVGFDTYYLDTRFEVKFLAVLIKLEAEDSQEMYPNPSSYALQARDTNLPTTSVLTGPFTQFMEAFHNVDQNLSAISRFEQFFKVIHNVNRNITHAGYWQYPSIYNSIPFDASYDDMIFDAFCGDVEIIANRTQYIEFSQPYIESKLRIVKVAVAATSIFEQFVKVVHDIDRNITYIGGFSINVFESAVRYLQYPLVYNLVPFYGSYDDMIKEVSLNNFDCAIGDILITANRKLPIEFSQPYIESNLVMVLTKTKPNIWKQSWTFLQPFSRGMWLLLAALYVSTCFVVWILEHGVNSGSRDKQIGTSLLSTFSTVMFANGEPIRSQWSRFVLAPWLFIVLIITSTYTANFSSMLTNSKLEPSKIDIGSLKRTNAMIGCDGNSFTIWYLKEVLGFKANNIKRISSKDEFANSLSNGHIRAAFMLSPQARVFVSEYCEFGVSGPTFKLTGFGYVFPRGSPLALDISESIIYLRQSGELQKLEEEKLSNSKCIASEPDSGSEGLGVAPFAGLFIISGNVSVVALIVAAIRQIRTHCQGFTFIKKMWICKGLWLWLATFYASNKAKGEIELSIESCDSRNKINNTCHGEEP